MKSTSSKYRHDTIELPNISMVDLFFEKLGSVDEKETELDNLTLTTYSPLTTTALPKITKEEGKKINAIVEKAKALRKRKCASETEDTLSALNESQGYSMQDSESGITASNTSRTSSRSERTSAWRRRGWYIGFPPLPPPPPPAPPSSPSPWFKWRLYIDAIPDSPKDFPWDKLQNTETNAAGSETSILRTTPRPPSRSSLRPQQRQLPLSMRRTMTPSMLPSLPRYLPQPRSPTRRISLPTFRTSTRPPMPAPLPPVSQPHPTQPQRQHRGVPPPPPPTPSPTTPLPAPSLSRTPAQLGLSRFRDPPTKPFLSRSPPPKSPPCRSPQARSPPSRPPRGPSPFHRSPPARSSISRLTSVVPPPQPLFLTPDWWAKSQPRSSARVSRLSKRPTQQEPYAKNHIIFAQIPPNNSVQINTEEALNKRLKLSDDVKTNETSGDIVSHIVFRTRSSNIDNPAEIKKGGNVDKARKRTSMSWPRKNTVSFANKNVICDHAQTKGGRMDCKMEPTSGQKQKSPMRRVISNLEVNDQPSGVSACSPQSFGHHRPGTRESSSPLRYTGNGALPSLWDKRTGDTNAGRSPTPGGGGQRRVRSPTLPTATAPTATATASRAILPSRGTLPDSSDPKKFLLNVSRNENAKSPFEKSLLKVRRPTRLPSARKSKTTHISRNEGAKHPPVSITINVPRCDMFCRNT